MTRFINYLNENKKIKAGAIPYLIKGDEIYYLFMIPSDPTYGGTNPQFAKGRIESGENVERAMLREIKEELGIISNNISNVHYLFTKELKGYTSVYDLHIYGVKLKSEKLKTPHYETKKVIWLKEDELKTVRKTQYNLIKKGIEIIKNRIRI